jgi:LysM repeat protein
VTSAPTRLPDQAEPGGALPMQPGPGRADAIGSWLDRLLRLTRLPVREAAEIRDELDSHLRERVRDLMLVGHDEPDAIHKSISELGDLALLAQRYRDANRKPIGRMLMQFTLITAVGAALGLSTIALQQSQPEQLVQIPVIETQPETTAEVPSLREFGGPMIVEADPEAIHAEIMRNFEVQNLNVLADESILRTALEAGPITEAFKEMALAADVTSSQVYWDYLADFGLDTESEIETVATEGQSIRKSFEMLSDTLGLTDTSRLDCRIADGLLEIATVEFFDRREMMLLPYAVAILPDTGSPLVQSDESETLTDMVTTLIEPAVWEVNGGYAAIYAAGDRLFVNAPLRIQSQVGWLLGELQANASLSPSNDMTLPRAMNTMLPRDNTTPLPSVEGMTLRLRAAGDRVYVEIVQGGEVRRIEATELEITAGSITSLRTSGPTGPSSLGADGRTYTVLPGDTMASISSQWLGSTRRMDELEAANPGLDAGQLVVGQELQLPQDRSGQAAENILPGSGD